MQFMNKKTIKIIMHARVFCSFSCGLKKFEYVKYTFTSYFLCENKGPARVRTVHIPSYLKMRLLIETIKTQI